MILMLVIAVAVLFCIGFYRHGTDVGFRAGIVEGKAEGLREGSGTITNVVKTLTDVIDLNNKHHSEVLDKNFVGAQTLGNTWQNIVRQKDAQLESHIKEIADLKNALEAVDDVFVETDDDDEDEPISVAAGQPSQDTVFGERSAATTALALYDQMQVANITLDNIKNAMSPESYRTLKQLLQIPGGKDVDRKSSN